MTRYNSTEMKEAYKEINNELERKNIEITKLKKDIINIMNNNNFTPQKQKKKKSLTKILFDEEIFEKYSRIRNRVLLYIHNLCTKMEYNDSSSP